MHLITSICKPRKSQHIKSIQKGFTIDTYCSLWEHHLAFTVTSYPCHLSVSLPRQSYLSAACWMVLGLRHTQPCLMEGMTDDEMLSGA